LLSGDREGLAGESGCNDINHSRIACGVPVTDECFDIAEDRSVVEDSIFDSGGNDPLAVVIDFDVSNVFESEQ
jgi:hypothetical protein